MNKYDKQTTQNSENDIKKLLTKNETVIWEGSPKKNAFIINRILPMMPIALIWLLIDGGMIITFLATGEMGNFLFFIIPFFALHLMPVWLWLSEIFTAKKRWENTKYAVTDKRIVIQTGFIGFEYQSVFYKDINNVRLRTGLIDKLLGVGDLYFETNKGMPAFLDIKDAYNLYPEIQKVVLDMQTDIEFPNAFRPDSNPGYDTKYEPKK